MRVLLLNQFYTPDVAATGQLMADLARGLVGRGHEVHVLCSRRTYGGGPTRYEAKEVLDGVAVHRVAATGLGRGNLALCAIDYASFYALASAKALALPRMDVCISLNTPPYVGLIGAMLARLRRTPLVLWMMDLFPELAVACGVLKPGSLPHRVLARLSRSLYRSASRMITLGEVMTRRVLEAGARPETLATVPNWVPGEAVRPMPADRSAMRDIYGRHDGVTLMYSGNMGRGHGLRAIVRAVALLPPDSGLRLLLVGKGKMRRPLEQLAAGLGVRNVAFHDPCPLDRLSDSLAMGDIHLVGQKPGTQGVQVPSKTYGILAAGRPILYVGPEDCEVAQLVRNSGAGLIARPGDVEGIALALGALVAAPPRRLAMARRARSYYQTHLGLARSVGRIIEEIESAAGMPIPVQKVLPRRKVA